MNLVGKVTSYVLNIWVLVAVGEGIIFSTTSTKALETTQPHIQWVPAFLSLEIKRPDREADHSPLSFAKAENAYVFMAWCISTRAVSLFMLYVIRSFLIKEN